MEERDEKNLLIELPRECHNSLVEIKNNMATNIKHIYPLHKYN